MTGNKTMTTATKRGNWPGGRIPRQRVVRRQDVPLEQTWLYRINPEYAIKCHAEEIKKRGGK